MSSILWIHSAGGLQSCRGGIDQLLVSDGRWGDVSLEEMHHDVRGWVVIDLGYTGDQSLYLILYGYEKDDPRYRP